MHFASKMANWLQLWFILILYNQHLRYVCFTLRPQTYRDEVAAKVCNETCFVFRSEQGHEVPPDKNRVPYLLPKFQQAQIQPVVISHLLYLHCATNC